MIAYLQSLISKALGLAKKALDTANKSISNAYSLFNKAYGQALKEGANALNKAKSYALAVVNKLATTVDAKISKFYKLALDYANKARNTALKELDKQVDRLKNRIADFFSKANKLAEALFKKASEAIDKVVADLNKLKDKYRKEAAYLWKRLEAFAKWFNADKLNKLKDLIDKRYGDINQFFNNPGGVILAFVVEYLIVILDWLFGVGLAYNDTPLPPKPDLSGFTGFGGPVDISIPDNLRNTLCAPLSALRVSGYRFSSNHPGLDLRLNRGQSVYAMHDGIVQSIGNSPTGYGIYLTLQGNEWWTLYAHLQAVNVRRGERVNCGDIIARGDSTGNSTGDHLHLEIKHNGVYINPLDVL